MKSDLTVKEPLSKIKLHASSCEGAPGQCPRGPSRPERCRRRRRPPWDLRPQLALPVVRPCPPPQLAGIPRLRPHAPSRPELLGPTVVVPPPCAQTPRPPTPRASLVPHTPPVPCIAAAPPEHVLPQQSQCLRPLAHPRRSHSTPTPRTCNDLVVN